MCATNDKTLSVMGSIPFFSVLIANYNNGKYLHDAIDSVLAQTYTKWEIIIVDDGSTDNSRDIYKQYSNNPHIHIYHNDKNLGCGYSKRRCVEIASGEICGFLDADDVLLPNALEYHVNMHTEHPEVSTVLSRYYRCDELMNVIGESRPLVIAEGKDYFTNRDYLPEHLASFKRSHYLKTQGIDSTLPAAVDQDLYFKLEETAPVYVSNAFTYKYRLNSNQISQRENSIKAFYWNLIVRHNTCLRRNLSPNEYPIKDLTELINGMEAEQHNLMDEIERTRATKAFRIGRTILHPFHWLRK